MSRLAGFFVVALILSGLPHAGYGQPVGPGSAAPITADTDNVIRLNPTLDSLNRVDPQFTTSVVIRLKRIGQSLQDDIRRGDAMPTAAEHAQLAANPAFNQAYRNRPDETLHLLRSVNDILSKSAR
jgi:hypothetical protein